MCKILIINDTRLINKLLKNSFESEGLCVDTVLMGKEGVELAKLTKYNLILLDYILPDINGDEVCRLLKEDEKTKGIPVYFISSLDKSKLAEIIKATGAEGYLDITIDMRDLIKKIKGLLGSVK